jgi:hypothetical protein
MMQREAIIQMTLNLNEFDKILPLLVVFSWENPRLQLEFPQRFNKSTDCEVYKSQFESISASVSIKPSIMNQIFIVFFVAAIAALTSSYPTGAPPSACENLVPRHGNHQPQTSLPPVRIVLSQDKVRPGETIDVKVEGIDSDYTFKGFVIQARNAETNKLVGTMEVEDGNSHVLDCNGSNSVTQSNIELKNSVSVRWTAPATAGDVKIL